MSKFMKELKKELNNQCKNTWIFTILTAGGAIGTSFAAAAKESKIKQFTSSMIGLIFLFFLNLKANLVFIFESKAELPGLDSDQKGIAKTIITYLWCLVITESILQFAFMLYAFCRVDKQLKNVTCCQMCFLTSFVILNDVILETMYSYLAIMLWINNDYANGVPLAGVLISCVFGYIVTVVDLCSLLRGNKLSDRRKAKMSYLLRFMATLMNALFQIHFFLDSKSKLEEVEIGPFYGNKTNFALLVSIILGIVGSIPFYFAPCFANYAFGIIYCDFLFSIVLEFCAVLCCCILFVQITDLSVVLLVSVILSYSLSGFLQAYNFGDLGSQYLDDTTEEINYSQKSPRKIELEKRTKKLRS